ncbi:MAG: OmpH family outer membrane protein [Bacteroidales bacterium]|jgi:outer membrane protein|nr:OmpH family outer membrane protein [Bacteroidales bacterium]
MKYQYLINIVFAFAIAIVLVLVVKSRKPETVAVSETTFVAVTDSSGQVLGKQQFPIAYIVLDSLMRNYDYFAKREKEYSAAAERESTKLQQQGAQIEQDMYALQTQYQQGLITSRDAEAKKADLEKRYQNFVQTQQRKSQEFEQKEMALTKELRDSVTAAISAFNYDNRFKIVLNNVFNSNILYAEEQLNITEPVLKLMNERYQKSQKK